jgi:xylulose-5-phosphate/fructose-6-phosphate phosphoketolase
MPWRRPIASLNYLLTSHVWRQDHNGFSHQDPGFIDPRRQQEGRYRPRLFAARRQHAALVTDHCLRSYDRINVIVAGKQPSPQWLTMDGRSHCTPASASGTWAGNDPGRRTRRGDGLRRRRADAGNAGRGRPAAQGMPDLKIRVVNVVDLMTLQPQERASARPATAISTRCSPSDKPVIFAYHGYPWLIHRLTYKRTNHANMHVRGYKEEGTTTTPFDMVVLNELDRFHLAIDVIDRVPAPICMSSTAN